MCACNSISSSHSRRAKGFARLAAGALCSRPPALPVARVALSGAASPLCHLLHPHPRPSPGPVPRAPPCRAVPCRAAALEALGKNKDALAAYEKARWLAQAHDNDPQGEQEYVEAVHALKLRMSMRDMGGYTRVM